MNCLWIILLLFGCGNNCGRNCGCSCGNTRGRNDSRSCNDGCDNDCGCDNDWRRDSDCGCDNDRGRDNDCGCDNDGVRRVRRDSDYDYDSSVRSSRYPNISRSSETCGCEKSEQSEQ